MDELELRIAALETAFIDLLALADPELLAKLEASLSQGLVKPGEAGYGGDEQAIRLQAIQHVKDGKLRHEIFTPFRPPRPADA